MSENVSFIQGSKERYTPSEMQGGVYFSKDTKEILLNGESYGNATPADEEDITAEDSNLKLKDRAYDEASFSGKGYKILRKNIQDGKNILTQDMINEPNTVYEIRYDFDLNGATINIPEGCVLKFNGGIIKNGNVNGTNTIIDSTGKYQIFQSIEFGRTFTNTVIYPEYFGAVADDNIDCTNSINEAAELCRLIDGNLEFFDGIYKVTDTINLSAINVNGNGAVIKGYIEEQKAIINIDPRLGNEWSSVDKRTRFIGNIRVDCNSQDNIGIKVFGDGQIFNNIHIREVGWLGFYSHSSGNATLSNFLIEGSSSSFDYSVGLALESPDWQVSDGVIQNVATGVISGSNFFNNIHTWGYSTRKRMYVHLLTTARCYISNWYFDTVNCRNEKYSNNPAYINVDNDDIKRREYVGNSAILCINGGSVNANTCRLHQAAGQEQENISPIFIFSDSSVTNYVLNTVVPDTWKSYKSSFDNATYILNNYDISITSINYNDPTALIKLCTFDEIPNNGSILFNIALSFNGIIINTEVSCYKDSVKNSVTVNGILHNINTVENFDTNYSVQVYKSDNSIYYRYSSIWTAVKKFIISYVDPRKIINPVISADDISESEEINLYRYSFYNGISNLPSIGDTQNRPQNAIQGFQYFDTILNKPVYWNGTSWIEPTENISWATIE